MENVNNGVFALYNALLSLFFVFVPILGLGLGIRANTFIKRQELEEGMNTQSAIAKAISIFTIVVNIPLSLFFINVISALLAAF